VMAYYPVAGNIVTTGQVGLIDVHGEMAATSIEYLALYRSIQLMAL